MRYTVADASGEALSQPLDEAAARVFARRGATATGRKRFLVPDDPAGEYIEVGPDVSPIGPDERESIQDYARALVALSLWRAANGAKRRSALHNVCASAAAGDEGALRELRPVVRPGAADTMRRELAEEQRRRAALIRRPS